MRKKYNMFFLKQLAIALLLLLLFDKGAFGQLSIPSLQYPTSGQTNINSPISFNWGDVSGITNYRIQVATSASGWTASSGFSSTYLVLNNNSPTTSDYTWSYSLIPGQTYYWSVKSGNASGSSNYAQYRSFTVITPLSITIL